MAKGKQSKGVVGQQIELPSEVSASVDGQFLLIKGAKGEVRRVMKSKNASIKIDGNKLTLESKSHKRKYKKLLNSLAAHIQNMVRGSTQNHTYVLKICSGHFPMNVSATGNKLVVKNFLGEKVPRTLKLKNGADVKVEGELIHVSSASKEIAGQVAADIEQLTRRSGYDTRIFQDGIYVINKDGKELK